MRRTNVIFVALAAVVILLCGYFVLASAFSAPTVATTPAPPAEPRVAPAVKAGGATVLPVPPKAAAPRPVAKSARAEPVAAPATSGMDYIALAFASLAALLMGTLFGSRSAICKLQPQITDLNDRTTRLQQALDHFGKINNAGNAQPPRPEVTNVQPGQSPAVVLSTTQGGGTSADTLSTVSDFDTRFPKPAGSSSREVDVAGLNSSVSDKEQEVELGIATPVAESTPPPIAVSVPAPAQPSPLVLACQEQLASFFAGESISRRQYDDLVDGLGQRAYVHSIAADGVVTLLRSSDNADTFLVALALADNQTIVLIPSFDFLSGFAASFSKQRDVPPLVAAAYRLEPTATSALRLEKLTTLQRIGDSYRIDQQGELSGFVS